MTVGQRAPAAPTPQIQWISDLQPDLSLLASLSASGSVSCRVAQSSFTLSSHLFLGLPLDRAPSVWPYNRVCGYLLGSIRVQWPKYVSLRSTVKFDMVTHMGRGLFWWASQAPVFGGGAPAPPILGVPVYLCLSAPFDVDDQIRRDNTYGDERF